MRLDGLTVHIAGRAYDDVDPSVLQYAHALIERLVQELYTEGCSFVIGFGKEPCIDYSGIVVPQIFDWSVANHVDRLWGSGISDGPRIYSVCTVKTESQVPSNRRDLWNSLRSQNLVHIDYVDPGWVSGAVRRVQMSHYGDLLIAIGGGEGVEHLARQYALQGKPVLPLDLDLGASGRDGNGGAPALAKLLYARPDDFLHAVDGFSLGTLLSRISTNSGNVAPDSIIAAIKELIRFLAPPKAFYVRLLDPTVQHFAAVNSFFSNVVTPVVEAAGYLPYQVGTVASTTPWINEQIFTGLHHSSMVIADVTGLRPNCFVELGYALGLSKRILITARNGTSIPFDIRPIDIHFWKTGGNQYRREQFQDYWKRNINRLPLTRARQLP